MKKYNYGKCEGIPLYYIILLDMNNSELPPYLSSGTWKNSERSLEAKLESHET